MKEESPREEAQEKSRELRHARTLEKLAKEERAEVKGYGKGGRVGGRGDGCATKGRTKGTMR